MQEEPLLGGPGDPAQRPGGLLANARLAVSRVLAQGLPDLRDVGAQLAEDHQELGNGVGREPPADELRENRLRAPRPHPKQELAGVLSHPAVL